MTKQRFEQACCNGLNHALLRCGLGVYALDLRVYGNFV